jgi:hypothetical protein
LPDRFMTGYNWKLIMAFMFFSNHFVSQADYHALG